MSVIFRQQTDRLGQKRINAVGKNHAFGEELVFARLNAGYPTGFILKQPIDANTRNELGALGLGLFLKPLVKFAAQHGVGCRLRGERFTRVIVKRHRVIVGNKGDLLTGHKALNGRFLSEARHDALEAVGVETAARHVFAAGIIAALNHENVKPFLGKNVGGHAAGYAGADYDGVEFFFGHG